MRRSIGLFVISKSAAISRSRSLDPKWRPLTCAPPRNPAMFKHTRHASRVKCGPQTHDQSWIIATRKTFRMKCAIFVNINDDDTTLTRIRSAQHVLLGKTLSHKHAQSLLRENLQNDRAAPLLLLSNTLSPQSMTYCAARESINVSVCVASMSTITRSMRGSCIFRR